MVHRQGAELGDLRRLLATLRFAAQQDAELSVDDGDDTARQERRRPAVPRSPGLVTRAVPRRGGDADRGPPACRRAALDCQVVAGQQPGWLEQLMERSPQVIDQ